MLKPQASYDQSLGAISLSPPTLQKLVRKNACPFAKFGGIFVGHFWTAKEGPKISEKLPEHFSGNQQEILANSVLQICPPSISGLAVKEETSLTRLSEL